MTGATQWTSPRSGANCTGHPAKPSTAACERPSRGISKTAGGGRESGRADTVASALEWPRASRQIRRGESPACLGLVNEGIEACSLVRRIDTVRMLAFAGLVLLGGCIIGND